MSRDVLAPEQVEREVARVVEEIHAAADGLAEHGRQAAAAAVRAVAYAGEDGGDLHESSAELVTRLASMSATDRILAIGGIFDVAWHVGQAGDGRELAASVLADLLFEIKQLWPDETDAAIASSEHGPPVEDEDGATFH